MATKSVPTKEFDQIVILGSSMPSSGKAVTAEQEIVEETSWHDLRLVVAHHPQRSTEQTLLRQERIAALQAQAQAWAGKLDGQDGAEAIVIGGGPLAHAAAAI